MKNKLLTLLFLTGAITGTISAQAHEFVGTQKCKSCHKSESKGAQYVLWENSAHGHAFETMLSDQAIAVAMKLGLKTAPSESPECLVCHTVGFGKGGYEVKDAAFWTPAEDDRDGQKAVKRMEGLRNVGCEMCHGAGGDYMKKKVMEGIFTGEMMAADYGLLKPTEETCRGCHNKKSPTHKEFNFEKGLAKIAHPYPEGMRPGK
ncbi:MAG: cytochrome c family protein [Candidatus Marinimicrobia bacterium]|nr:cytochrome c family protein [Candidatus Neomarinimicrobiota bacterium]